MRDSDNRTLAMTEAASAGRPPPGLLRPGSPLWPGPKFLKARLPAFAGPLRYLGSGSPLWPDPKCPGTWLPAKARPQAVLRPSALQSPGLKIFGVRLPAVAGPQASWDLAPRCSQAPSFCGPAPRCRRTTSLGGYEARLPALAGPQVPMRPGAPLSPGLTEKTRYKPAWFTSGGELSQRSFLASRGPIRGPAQPLIRAVTWGSAAGRCAARKPGRRSAVSGPRW